MDKVRVLVIGDSGVGKTSFLSQICTNETSKTNEWTVGAQVFVKAHDSYGLDGSHRLHFVEFWDIGGHRNYASARRVFYEKLNGIILMYDLTNIKSFHNLRYWIDELVRADRSKVGGIEDHTFQPTNHSVSPSSGSGSGLVSRHVTGAGSSGASSSRIEKKILGSLPILVVGNKCDLANGRQQSKFPNSMKTFGVPSITVSAFMDSVQQGEKLGPFLQQVIDHKYFPNEEAVRTRNRIGYSTLPESAGSYTVNPRRPSEGEVKGKAENIYSSLWRTVVDSVIGKSVYSGGKVTAVADDDVDHIL